MTLSSFLILWAVMWILTAYAIKRATLFLSVTRKGPKRMSAKTKTDVGTPVSAPSVEAPSLLVTALEHPVATIERLKGDDSKPIHHTFYDMGNAVAHLAFLVERYPNDEIHFWTHADTETTAQLLRQAGEVIHEVGNAPLRSSDELGKDAGENVRG